MPGQPWIPSRRHPETLWVPENAVTSGDLGVFVDQAPEPVAAPNAHTGHSRPTDEPSLRAGSAAASGPARWPSSETTARRTGPWTELPPLSHAPARLRVLVTLAPSGTADSLSFTRLQELLGLTPGDLIIHLRKLEDAGYVTTVKTGSGVTARTLGQPQPARSP